ncbi:MAG: SGNH/GDSL hydrolase family protein, partial [Thermoplasmata archaeon]|nr:SGNH/GDSL hydrolase family protein [Thermoplasmata archaeon]
PPVPSPWGMWWCHRPGARADFSEGSYAINSLGLRDEERGYVSTNGAERILVMGDSFAEGFSVRFEDCVSQVLQRQLRSAGWNVDVIDGGVVGYSTDQEYLLYKRETARYGARVVVLLFFYNDILANVMDSVGAPKPLLAWEDGSLRLLNDPVPQPPHAANVVAHAHPPYPLGSAALEWVRKRLSASPAAYRAVARTGLWEAQPPVPPPEDMKVFKRRTPRAQRRAWNATTRLLQALHDEVGANGARLLVAYVPSKMEVSERDWGLTQVEYALDPGLWNRRQVARDLAGAGENVGFPVLDLTAALRKVDNPILGGPYHDHGGHWNAVGHRVAAESVGRFLLDHGWLGSSSGQRRDLE